MALNVNWQTKEILIPQSDLTFVSGTNYELDTNQFRLEIKSIEETEGLTYLDTHRHNTEVNVAGTTFARTIEIINGYSIKFEDTGSDYSVTLIGSNNNLFDVENGILNPTPGVTVISTNAAGLISEEEDSLIYGGRIYVNSTGVSGTDFGIGTRINPVNNISDAVSLANQYNFNKIHFISDFTFTSSDSISGFQIIGEGESKNILTFNSGSSVSNCEILHCKVTGDIDGCISFFNCLIDNVTLNNSNSIVIKNCYFKSTQTIDSTFSSNISIIDSWTTEINSICLFNLNSSSANLIFRDLKGQFNISGVTDSNCLVEVNKVDGSSVTILSSCTGGQINLTGLIGLIDQSSGSSVLTTGIIYPGLTPNQEETLESAETNAKNAFAASVAK